jgi:hypothetical protein
MPAIRPIISIDTRVRDMLKSAELLSSEDISAMIAEVTTALATADMIATNTAKDALDPLVVDEALFDTQIDAERHAHRYRNSIAALQVKLKEAEAREAAAAWRFDVTTHPPAAV